jgi:hypothetical protein
MVIKVIKGKCTNSNRREFLKFFISLFSTLQLIILNVSDIPQQISSADGLGAEHVRRSAGYGHTGQPGETGDWYFFIVYLKS